MTVILCFSSSRGSALRALGEGAASPSQLAPERGAPEPWVQHGARCWVAFGTSVLPPQACSLLQVGVPVHLLIAPLMFLQLQLALVALPPREDAPQLYALAGVRVLGAKPH